MDISLSGRSEDLIADLIKQGRFRSASETVEEGLRLLDEREARLAALRAHINASLADPELLAEQDVSDDLDLFALELARRAY